MLMVLDTSLASCTSKRGDTMNFKEKENYEITTEERLHLRYDSFNPRDTEAKSSNNKDFMRKLYKHRRLEEDEGSEQANMSQ